MLSAPYKSAKTIVAWPCFHTKPSMCCLADQRWLLGKRIKYLQFVVPIHTPFRKTIWPTNRFMSTWSHSSLNLLPLFNEHLARRLNYKDKCPHMPGIKRSVSVSLCHVRMAICETEYFRHVIHWPVAIDLIGSHCQRNMNSGHGRMFERDGNSSPLEEVKIRWLGEYFVLT